MLRRAEQPGYRLTLFARASIIRGANCGPLARRYSSGILGVVAGSLFTLLGVWFTNRATARRLERQFEHERAVRKEERELALRRDVYIPVVEALAAQLSAITALSSSSVSLDKLREELHGRTPAIAAAGLVATDVTLAALVRFQTALGTAMVGLGGLRIGSTLRPKLAELKMDEVNRVTSENAGHVALLEQSSQDVSAEGMRRTAEMRQKIAEGSARAAELRKEHGDLTRAAYDEEVRIQVICVKVLAQLNEMTVPLLAAAREELGLPFDAETYLRILKESQEKTAADIDFLVENTKSVIFE